MLNLMVLGRAFGSHIIDVTLPAEVSNWSAQVTEEILLRTLVLAIDRPLVELIPALAC